MSGAKRLRSTLIMVTVGMMACAPAFGGSRVVGTLAGSMNATVEGLSPEPSATIFAGQHLRVKDGEAVVATATGVRLIFGRNTSAWFPSAQDEVAVQLEQGDVSVYVPSGGPRLRVNAGGVSLTPVGGFPTLCQLAMRGDFIGVVSRKGAVRMEGNGAPVEVPAGKEITIRTRNAASPQGAPAGSGGSTARAGGGGGGPSVLTVAALAAGVTGAVVGFVGIHKANTANNEAKTADSAANAASSAATAAATAATAATQAATAATAAANSATSAATAAGLLAVTLNNQLGCLLNQLAGEVNKPSPYTPPSGQSCP